jgi:hypothetical protein
MVVFRPAVHLHSMKYIFSNIELGVGGGGGGGGSSITDGGSKRGRKKMRKREKFLLI